MVTENKYKLLVFSFTRNKSALSPPTALRGLRTWLHRLKEKKRILSLKSTAVVVNVF